MTYVQPGAASQHGVRDDFVPKDSYISADWRWNIVLDGEANPA